MPNSGKYCNGDRFILSPCTYTGDSTVPYVVEDAPDLEGGAQTNVVKNGAELNMGAAVQNVQSFTDRTTTGNVGISYNASRDVAAQTPYVFLTGEEGSITKSIFDEDGDDAGRPLITRRHSVTVCAQEPPTGAFRPGFASISKVSSWAESDMLDTTTLPQLTMPINALNTREFFRWDQCIEQGDGSRFDKVNPAFNVPGRFGARGPGLNGAGAVLALCADIDPDLKRDIAVAVCQAAIDLYERAVVMNDLGHIDWGGANGQIGLGAIGQRGYKIVILAGGILLNDANIIAMGQSQMFAEDGSSQYITQTIIDNGVSQPGNTTGGFAQYVQADLGMPEWTQANVLQTNAGNRAMGDSYRRDNMAARVRHANAIHLFPDMYANYLPTTTRDPFLDYADRMMERDSFKDSADPDNVFQFARVDAADKSTRASDITIWDTYRVSNGQTAVWDWPA